MAKSKEGSCLHFPRSHSTPDHRPSHTGGSRPGTWVRQPDAIKLRPSGFLAGQQRSRKEAQATFQVTEPPTQSGLSKKGNLGIAGSGR